MTFDPQHDYEQLAAAKRRLGNKLQEDCDCAACQAADVGHGQDGKILVQSSRIVDGKKEFIGRWRHGFELKAELTERRRLFEGMKETLRQRELVER